MNGWEIVDAQHDNEWEIRDTARDIDEYDAKQERSRIIEDTNRIINRIYMRLRGMNEL